MTTATMVVRIKARPGMAERVRKELLALAAPTRTDAKCISYNLHQSTEPEGLFMLCANWVDQRALDEHLRLPYLQVLREKLGDSLAEPAEITLWERIR